MRAAEARVAEEPANAVVSRTDHAGSPAALRAARAVPDIEPSWSLLIVSKMDNVTITR